MLTPGDGTRYSDGVTRITDPFYVCECPGGHTTWSCTYVRKCGICGKKLIRCVPADQYSGQNKKEAASGN